MKLTSTSVRSFASRRAWLASRRAWLALTLALAAGALLLVSACGGISQEEFSRIADEAKLCEPGDTCVLAGAGQCTCDFPVNADAEERVEQAVEDLDCMGAVVDCIGFTNPRCENGMCVGDMQ